uniref:TIL domain containing protein n=1 Tax=Rhipicephalus zambeziensis TaxID=60191 RepID=A0A224YKZ8_9ACAR
MQKSGVAFLFIGICLCLEYASSSAGANSQCAHGEEPVKGYALRRDRFCKPWITSPAEVFKLRRCVCQPDYLRNAWGHCVKESACKKCFYERNADFNGCSPSCPLRCGKPLPEVCTLQCVIGCACAPGFVLDPWWGKLCVPARVCPPRCPPHSSYQMCASTCEPTCEGTRPDKCVTQCHRGGCVCWPGFYKTYHKGKAACVPWYKCGAKAE